jgi:adenosylcobinamide-GDP ribazoletransferase
MKRVRLAIGFLTVLPAGNTGEYVPGDLGRAAGWFPWIGALLGAVVAAAYTGLARVIAPLPAAALATALWIVLTGGLHLDGLADSCDGLPNASSRERRLEIMKDPRLGSFGGIGLVLAILLKFTCLASIPVARIWLALPLAAALGRWLLLWAGKQPLARPGGMGADFAAGLNAWSFLQAAIVPAGLAVLAGWTGLAAILCVHLLAWLIFQFARSRLGGVTGDIFGLLVELTEITVLLVFCIQG